MFLYILNVRPLSEIWFANIIFLFYGLSFHLLETSFETPNFLMLKPSLSIFNLVALLLVSYLRNYCLFQVYKDLHLCFLQSFQSDFTFIFHFHALGKEMATHSNVLAWRIPGKAEPGGLPSMGSHTVGHD